MSEHRSDHEPHEHGPEHHHPHAQHDHGPGLLVALRDLVRPHSHDSAAKIDSALAADSRGVRALKTSPVALLLTSGLQLAVVLVSGSVALLSDTLHNFADAITAVPIWLAFIVGPRGASRGVFDCFRGGG